MDLEHLRTLVAVAEAGSFSAAARERRLSQPALSQHVRALESALGLALLHRGSRGVTLTAAGEAILGHARLALRAVAAAQAEASEIRGLVRGTLRLGATDAAATLVLPPVFANFHRRHPGIEVVVEIHGTLDLVERLRDGRLDLGLCTLPVEGPDLDRRPLLTETLGLVTPAAARRTPLPRLVRDLPFIAYPRGSITRHLVDAALRRAGLSTRPIMEIGRPSVMLRLVAAGLGLSVLPDAVSQEGGPPVYRVPSRRFCVERQLGLVRLKGRVPEPAARAFEAMLPAAAPARWPRPDGEG